ncbi:MAG: (d)CMP kinase [Spirochaetes bacterium]|nr:(d)CMP kinase [Spirochaetota bacterium]
MVIAIDGPAGTGKSTVAKSVAKLLGLFYLDTGAMYRAFTLYALSEGTPLDDLKSLKRLLRRFSITITADRVYIEGRDVTTEIRSSEVTANVSYISSLEFVRKKMVELQREIGKNRDIVVEGRDIGTVVFPDTPNKFYLDAEVEERARRRLNDEKDAVSGTDLETIKKSIEKRDRFDSTRAISPLKRAHDATYIDTTDMSVTEVCDVIIRSVQ